MIEELYRRKIYNSISKKWIVSTTHLVNNSDLIERTNPLTDNINEDFLFNTGCYNFFLDKENEFAYAKEILSPIGLEKFYNSSNYEKLHDYELQSVKNDVAFKPKIVQKILKQTKNRHSILDIGAGFGALLNDFKPYFNVLHGIEFSQVDIQHSLKTYDIELFNDFEKIQKSGYKYDVIIFEQVIEHLADFDIIDKAASVLKPEGIMYIGCPNLNSLSMKLFNKYHTHVLVPVHINMFSKKSINLLAIRNSLYIEEIISSPFLDINISDLFYYIFNKKKFFHRHCGNNFFWLLLDKIFGFFTNRFMHVYLKINPMSGSYLEVVLKKSN